MRPILFRVAYAMMGVIACAWPLGIYQHVPLTGLTIVNLSGAVIVLLWLIDLALYRIPRVSFELLWPAALISTIAIAFQVNDAPRIAGIAVLFLSTVHFARQRDTIEHWLTWSAVGCLVAGVADLVYRAGYGWPTAYVIPANLLESSRLLDAASAMSGSLPNAAITLFTGTLLWAAIAYRTKRNRALPILGFLVMVAALILHCAGVIAQLQASPSGWWSITLSHWILGGVTVWLLARIGAKVLVERERKPDGQYEFIAAPIIAMAVTFCVAGIEVMAWYAWAAALAAGYAMRDKRAAPVVSRQRLGSYAAVALVPYIAVNAVFVDQTNPHDGRNYAQALIADYDAHALDRVIQRSEFWNQRTGDSGIQEYWSSQVALDLGRPDAAAAWAVRLSRGGGTHGGRRPIPSANAIDTLLYHFRDVVSALPEDGRGIAYERTLSAISDAEAAESSLRLRISDANPIYEDIDRAPLENAAAFLFQDIRPFIDFSDWSVAELIALFNLVGAHVVPAPEDVDRSWLPATVTVRRDPRRVWVTAISAVSRAGAFHETPNLLLTTPPQWPDDAWQIAALPFDASWQVTLRSSDDPITPIATITFSADGQPDVLLAEPFPQTAPDEPAVFIWLP